VSGDNALTVNSNDVLSTSSTDYIQAEGTVLERVVRTQYTQDGAATGALQTTTERQAAGGIAMAARDAGGRQCLDAMG
jgi:hypothetical protein